MHNQIREPMERKKLYRISEVAGMFGIKPVTLRKWIRDGRVTTIRAPWGRPKITNDEVERVFSVMSEVSHKSAK